MSVRTFEFDENVHEQPSGDAYDVVVIGSGLVGLTAGALLAKAGKKVLVAERHHRPGGYVHGFEREGYVFDSAVHLLSAEGGLAQGVLTALGADDACKLVRSTRSTRSSCPTSAWRCRSGWTSTWRRTRVTSRIRSVPCGS
jgi:phytoene dehydrogenase-like protein